MDLITYKFDQQAKVNTAIQTEMLNLINMEDDVLVDEVEHLIGLSPDFEFDLLPIIFDFYEEKRALTIKERKLLEGSYMLGHLDFGIEEDGHVKEV